MSETGSEGALSPSLHDTLGRHTAAGALLFNLYNGDRTGRRAGNAFSERNRRSFRTSAITPSSTSSTAQPVLPAKAAKHLSVPKFGRRGEEENKAPCLRPCRRPAAVILQEHRREQELECSRPLPPPKGPLLDDAEKERCAMLMQHRGKLPELPPCEELRSVKLRAASGHATSERSELEALFESVRQEIEERKAYLEDLKATSKQSEFSAKANIVRREMLERARELERIDRLIREC